VVRIESRDAKPSPKMAADRYASLRCSERAVAWAKSFKSEAAERNMIVGGFALGVRPDGGQCPVTPFYGISVKLQRNVRVKIDTPEKG
jgi:hypothetical protein